MLDLPFTPDRKSPAPLYRQLADHVSRLISQGRLTAGAKLPPTRILARQLGLNRNTINRAYQELLVEGEVTAGVGRGTFVANRTEAPRPLDLPATQPSPDWQALLTPWARDLEAPPHAAGRRVNFDFRGGRVATDALPARSLRRAMLRAAERLSEVANEGDPRGWLPLRERVAEYLLNRGVSCRAEDVIITNGVQQALDLTARLFLRPGEAVALEQPGYFGASHAFAAAGAELLGVPVDGRGLQTAALARLLRRRAVKLIYTTPSAQSPTGAVLGSDRRSELMELAASHGILLFEDDYDSELRFGAPPVAALKSDDRSGRVVYAATFGKILFPSLRLGCMVLDSEISRRVALARWSVDFQSGLLPQLLLAELLESGQLERHVRRMRQLYAERLAVMVAALEEAMPSGTTWQTPGGGLGLWLRWPDRLDPHDLRRRAFQQGIAFTPGEVFFFDGRGDRHSYLTFSSMPPAAISNGIHRLGRIASRQLAATRRRLRKPS